MKKFEFMAHPADEKFRAYGRTREDQFKNAGYALYSLIAEGQEIEACEQRDVRLDAADGKGLLVAWLTELLYLLDAESFLLKDVLELKITEDRKRMHLAATLCGDTRRERYAVRSDVKAITYAEMEITEEYVQVVVDV